MDFDLKQQISIAICQSILVEIENLSKIFEPFRKNDKTAIISIAVDEVFKLRKEHYQNEIKKFEING